MKKVQAVMARRILVNFRVDPEPLRGLLPCPFVPKRVNGWGLAGICLIRLERMRPAFLPAVLGVASENAAHRIAVEWEEGATRREGVFIPRRDTDSWLNRLVGGRLFPGVHHAAVFNASEGDQRYTVELCSRDRRVQVRVQAHRTDRWTDGSLFKSLAEACAFFRGGCCGWSLGENGREIEGVELCADQWEMHPLAVELVESSFFADQTVFPPGTVEFDSALLMRGISHVWRVLDFGDGGRTVRRPPPHGPSALFELP